MVNRTYVEYKGEVYSWNDLLSKLNLDVNSNISGRVNFYRQASEKQLKNVKCLTKDDDGEYVEICNLCEELIDDCTCYDPEDDEEETCEECGESIDDCVCEKIEYEDDNDGFEENLNFPIPNGKGKIVIRSNPSGANCYLYDYKSSTTSSNTPEAIIDKPGIYELSIECNEYKQYIKKVTIDKNKITYINAILIPKDEKLKEETLNKIIKKKDERLERERVERGRLKLEEQKKLDELKEEKLQKLEIDNENRNYETLNDKKIITRAQLPNGEMITWVDLLKRYNLSHGGGSAYIDWLSHKSKDMKGRLPDVKRVDFSGNNIDNKNKRVPISQYEKIMSWDRYFPKVSVGLCPCCEEITITHDYFRAGHNIPVSKGGTNDIKNLVPICGRCNGRMSDSYTIVEFKTKYYPNSKRKLMV